MATMWRSRILSFFRGWPIGSLVARVPILAAFAGLTLLAQGCGTTILASSWGARPETLSIGSGREQVEKELGKPVHSRSLPDGGRADTYDFRAYKPSEWKERFGGSGSGVGSLGGGPGAAYALLAAGMIYGVAEILVITPYAVYKLSNHPRNRVEVSFGPDDRAGWIGSPPPYGPSDDALGRASIGSIRKNCWSGDDVKPATAPDGQESSADRYVACVARGLAAWGDDYGTER